MIHIHTVSDKYDEVTSSQNAIGEILEAIIQFGAERMNA
jgi:hypothetical protein